MGPRFPRPHFTCPQPFDQKSDATK